MKLLSIETHNFKKLKSFKADFTDGLNVIVGDNAQGKSTLLQAIECALYGASVVPGKADKIPTWGQSTWKVELVFTLNGEDYRLTRSKSTAKLERVSDGESSSDTLVANGHTPVTAAVTELLDLNAKDYNLFLQSKQGETSGVLTFGAAALNRKVEAFAGISLIDRVQSLAQEEYRTHKASAEALAVDTEELEAAEQSVAALAEAALDAEANMYKAQEALDTLPKVGDLAQPLYNPDDMQRTRDQFARLERDLATAKVEAKAAQEKYDDALQRFDELEVPGNAGEMEAELAKLRADIKPAVARVNELDRQLANRQQLVDQLTKAEFAMDDARTEDEIGEELTQALDNLQYTQEKKEESSSQALSRKHKIDQLRALSEDAVCPTCNTQLSEHDPKQLADDIATLTGEKKEWDAKFAAFLKQEKELSQAVGKWQRELEARQTLEAEVDRLRVILLDWPPAEKLEAQQAEAREIHQSVLIEHANLEHRVEQVEAEQARYDRAKRRVNAAERELVEAKEELVDLQNRHDEIVDDIPSEADIEKVRRELREYEAEKARRQHALASAQHVVELAQRTEQQAQKDLDAARHEVSKLKDRQSRSQAAAKTADAAARLAKFLRERRAGYLQEVWDAVLAAASKQVAMASKSMITRLVYDDGDFLFEEEGVLAPVTSASGAQKAHIGVALRIGLSRALYGSSALIIFDEPTESMSEHHASGLSASLAGAASQCLLITHREQDQDLAANVVEVAA